MKYEFEFWAVPKHILARQDISLTSKMLYAILVTRANGENLSWPSQKKLADDMALSVRQIRRCTDELVEAGLIESLQRGNSQTNIYKLVSDRTSMSPGGPDTSVLPDRTPVSHPLLKEHRKEHIPLSKKKADSFSSLKELKESDRAYLRLIARWYEMTKTQSKDTTDFNRRIKAQTPPAVQLTRKYKPREILTVLQDLTDWWEKGGEKPSQKPTLYSVLKILEK